VLEQRRGDWYADVNRNDKENVKTTVFICDDSRLTIGSSIDGSYIGYCVLSCQKGMIWENYGEYFPTESVRVATCYMPMSSSIEESARALTEFIIMKPIYGNILLIGYGQGGLMMYKVGNMLPRNYKTNITVMTIAAPFADVVKNDSQVAPELLEPLQQNRNHIAFIKNENLVETHSRFHGFLNRKSNCNKSDAILIERQRMWPSNGNEKRNPELVIHIARLEQSTFTKMVLSNFGKFAAGEEFFSEISSFRDSHEFRNLVAYNLSWDED